MLHLTICMLVAFFTSDVISSNATEYIYSCAFEEDLCYFERFGNDTAGMQRVKLNGNYVMLANDTSRMASLFNGKDVEACLRMKYEVVHGSLQGHLLLTGNVQKVYRHTEMSLSKTNGWKTALLNFTSSEDFLVVLFANVSSSGATVVYDEISIDYRQCP